MKFARGDAVVVEGHDHLSFVWAVDGASLWLITRTEWGSGLSRAKAQRCLLVCREALSWGPPS